MNDIELLSHKLSYLRDYVRHLEQKGNPAVKGIAKHSVMITAGDYSEICIIDSVN